MAFIFKDWLFEQFPEYVQEGDSYQVDGEGLLKRYLRSFGMELDEDFVLYIETFTEIIDVEKCDDKFLPLIATILGSPPVPDNDKDLYRKVLSYALAIYKVKGTSVGFSIFLGLLGLNSTIIEDAPEMATTYDIRDTYYDQGYTYDNQTKYCTGFRIGYSSINDTTNPMSINIVPQSILDKVEKIVCFLKPINARYEGLVKAIRGGDTFDTNITDSYQIT